MCDDSPTKRKENQSSPTSLASKKLTALTKSTYTKKSKWSDLPKRLATVTIGAPLIVGILSNANTCQLFFQIVHILCSLEWIQLFPKHKKVDDDGTDLKMETKRSNIFTFLFPLFSFVVVNVPSEMVILVLSLLSATIYVVGTIGSMKDSTNDDNQSKHMAFGLIYLSLSFHCWIKVCQHSLSHTIFLLFIVWNCDSGALVAGRLFGRKTSSQPPSWILKISPAKSMAGFAGGIVFGVITALTWPRLMLYVYHQILLINENDGIKSIYIGYGQNILDAILHSISFTFKETPNESIFYDISKISLTYDRYGSNEGMLNFHSTFLLKNLTNIMCRRVVVGFVLSLAAIAGDLVESAVKRNSGKKDSGKLLPGHGGILDRFDSTFIAIIIYYHWCVMA